jgi:hypothetical protein
MCSFQWSPALVSKPRATTRAIDKCLIQRDFFFACDSRTGVERQTMPRLGRQVFPRGTHAHHATSDAITRQSLPTRQIFLGRTCRATSAVNANLSAIYLAF